MKYHRQSCRNIPTCFCFPHIIEMINLIYKYIFIFLCFNVTHVYRHNVSIIEERVFTRHKLTQLSRNIFIVFSKVFVSSRCVEFKCKKKNIRKTAFYHVIFDSVSCCYNRQCSKSLLLGLFRVYLLFS